MLLNNGLEQRSVLQKLAFPSLPTSHFGWRFEPVIGVVAVAIFENKYLFENFTRKKKNSNRKRKAQNLWKAINSSTNEYKKKYLLLKLVH